MSTDGIPHTTVDPFSDEILTDPYDWYEDMRAAGPVVYVPERNFWAFTRYDNVREALARHDDFSSDSVGFNEHVNESLVGTALASDPPDHTPLRKVLSDSLSPRALRGLKADIDGKAEALVAELVEQGKFDGVEDFARVFPISIVLDLIGLPEDLRPKVLGWSVDPFNLLGPMNERAQAGVPNQIAMAEFLTQLKAEDLTEGSFGRAAFEAVERGEIDPHSGTQVLLAYISAGLDTTIAGLGNALALFGAHPDQWDLVREDPTRIPAAFNEVLRIESPVQMFGRRARHDVAVEGAVIPENDIIGVMYASGNRDDRHYQDPKKFDITRDASDHLAFGYGVHACAGQGLARLEVDGALRALAKSARRIHTGTPERKLNNITRSLDRLPVEVELA